MKRLLIIFLLFLVALNSVLSADIINSKEKEIRHILRKVAPSVVKVVAEGKKKYVGTGIALARDRVLTTTLLLKGRPDILDVVTVKGEKYRARVIGKDPVSAVAVLKLDKGALTAIPVAHTAEVGDWIALVGVFYHRFPAINQGIVSSVSSRELILNAPVLPGSAGGAVVNRKGELIGVIRGRFAFSKNPEILLRSGHGDLLLKSDAYSGRNLCYAVPAGRVLEISKELKLHGRVRRGWLGIYIEAPVSGSDGLVVSRVVQGSPAQKAGLRTGDRILTLNGKGVSNPGELSLSVQKLAPDSVVKIEISRGKKRETRLVRIVEKSGSQFAFGETAVEGFRNPGEGSLAEFVRRMRGRLPELKRYVFDYENVAGASVSAVAGKIGAAGSGIVVYGVVRGSAAQAAGLKKNDIIVSVAGSPVHSPEQFRVMLEEASSADAEISLDVVRNSAKKKISMDLRKGAGSESWSGLPGMLKGMHVEFFDRSLESLRNRIRVFTVRLNAMNAGFRQLSEEKIQKMEKELENIGKQGEAEIKNQRKKLEREISLIRKALENLKKNQAELAKKFRKMKSEDASGTHQDYL